MRYIQNNLLQNEKFVYGVRPHWVIFASGFWAMFFAVVFWLFVNAPAIDVVIYEGFTLRDIIAIVLFLVGVHWTIRAYVYYVTSEYGVTDKRVVIKTGWIQRKSLELILDKVEGVLVDQTVSGRIFNFGTITVIGTGGTRDSYPFIPNPLKFRQVVQQQIDYFEERMRPRQ